MSVDKKMTFEAARLRALSSTFWPAFTRALLSVHPVKTDDVETAAVDKYWRVYYNPKWFGELKAEQAAAVLVHELWHLLRWHHVRATLVGVKKEEMLLWNMAADVEIHTNSGKLLDILLRMPEHSKPLTTSSFQPELPLNGIAESWFAELKNRMPCDVPSMPGVTGVAGCRTPNFGQGSCDPSSSKPNVEGSGVSNITAPWELPAPADCGVPGITSDRARIIIRATAMALKQQASKSRGSLALGETRWADEVIEPRVDWRVYLRTTFQGIIAPVFGNSSWTYKRLGRRQPSDPALLIPGRRGFVPRIAVIIDTSGSVDARMLSLCKQELTSLLGAMGQRAHVFVYTCDAQAHDAQNIYNGSQVKMYGGGGTDMRVAFDALKADAKKANVQFDLTICMTDGITPWPTPEQISSSTLILLLGKTSTPINNVPAHLKTGQNKTIEVLGI